MAKIRTAIIGLGKIAHGYDDISAIKKQISYPTHLSALKKDTRFSLIAVSDVSIKARGIFRKKVSDSVVLYSDYKEMIKTEDIDLLVVALPTELHYKVCAKALKSGIKNILCEKPITNTSAEAKKLMNLAKKHKAQILVNYNRSYYKSYEQLALAIKNKVLK